MTVQNSVLASIDRDVPGVLTPYLRHRSLRAGEIVVDGDWVLFPQAAILSVSMQSGGNGVSLGVTGSEGMIGWSSVLDVAPSTYRATCLLAGGDVLTIPTTTLKGLAEQNVRLQRALLRFVGTFTLQMARTLASNLRDPLDRRLARWIAMLHDRVEGDALPITHAAIAEALGVRRASVTDALHILEGERVLRCTRGMIVVRDRVALEMAAGAFYGPAEGVGIVKPAIQPRPSPTPTALDRVLVSLC